MTRSELGQALSQYRAGLEAEISLLHQLSALPTGDNGSATLSAAELSALADDRDRVMANIASIEQDLMPLRAMLSAARALVRETADFAAVTQLHQQARALVSTMLESDRLALDALRTADRARRFAADEVEKGEATVAAYRRVVSPPLEGARIVDRRG